MWWWGRSWVGGITAGDFVNEKIMKSKISLVSPNETWMKMYYTLKSIWNTKWKPNDKVMKFFSQCFEYTMKKIQCIFTMTFHCIFIALRTTIHWIFIDVSFTFKSIIHFHYNFIEWHKSTPMKTLLFMMFSLAIYPVVLVATYTPNIIYYITCVIYGELFSMLA